MENRPLVPILKEMPIERIFREIMGRKMTALERITFHLKPVLKPIRKTS
jgi:hypothetical protein